MFLPLKADNWITCGNALRLDWLSLCPPTGTGVKVQREDLDLWGETREQAEIEFENEGGETYICGNPPYRGSQWRTEAQQEDMKQVFSPYTKKYRDLDYVACWFILAMKFLSCSGGRSAFVATKSICQGIQVSMLWSLLFKSNFVILFAYRPFDWRNLATANAGVTCIIVGIGKPQIGEKRLFEGDKETRVKNIGPYLIPMPNIIVQKSSVPLNELSIMDYGNKPSDGGHLIFSRSEVKELIEVNPEIAKLFKQYIGAQEFTRSTYRYCLWLNENNLNDVWNIPRIRDRIEAVKVVRKSSKGLQSQSNVNTPHRFVYTPHQEGLAIIVPSITSSNREYLPCGITDGRTVASNKCAVIYNAEIWLLAIVTSSLHLQWIATVCVRMRTDFSYSNTLGWNTFPVPALTDQNKADLTRCAEDILLAREQYFPATIADMYDPKRMDSEFPLVREAHNRNDEAIDRIYIGRRFKNDTERLEKLFELYTKMKP